MTALPQWGDADPVQSGEMRANSPGRAKPTWPRLVSTRMTRNPGVLGRNSAGPGGDGSREVIRGHIDALLNAEYSPETIRNRECVLFGADDWLREHRDRSLLTAGAHDVQAWLTWLRTTRSAHTARMRTAGTRRQYLMHVRAWAAWALSVGYLDVNPVATIQVPAVRPSRPREFPEDRIPVAIRCAREPVKTWLVLGLYMGMRLSECRLVERCDVLDQESPPLIHVHGKGNRDRLLPLSAEVLVVLAPWLRTTRSGLLFRDRHGGEYDRRRASHLVSDYLHGLGIDASMHWTRHRAATKAIRDGHRVTAVQQFLGHASLTSTMIYVHEAEDAVRAIVDDLGMDMARVTGRPDLRLIRGNGRTGAVQ